MSKFRTSFCGFLNLRSRKWRPPYNLQNLSLPTVKLCVVVYCTTFWPTYIQTSVPDVGECCKAVSECKTKWVRRFLSGESTGNYATLFLTSKQSQRKKGSEKESNIKVLLCMSGCPTGRLSQKRFPVVSLLFILHSFKPNEQSSGGGADGSNNVFPFKHLKPFIWKGRHTKTDLHFTWDDDYIVYA